MTWVPLHNNQPRLKNGQARERAVRTYRMNGPHDVRPDEAIAEGLVPAGKGLPRSGVRGTRVPDPDTIV